MSLQRGPACASAEHPGVSPAWMVSNVKFFGVLGHSGTVNINPDPYEEMAVVKNSRETSSLY